MNTLKTERKGVTLIELVVTLLLAGIMAGIVTSLLIFMTQGYITVQRQVGRAQNIDLAMSRLAHEVRSAESISGGGTSFVASRGGVARSFSLSGNLLNMRVAGNNYPLIRNVSVFNVQPGLLGVPGLVTFTIQPVGSVSSNSIQVLFQPEGD